jgi:soluble calcium-activated nucleotidase 1
MHKSESGINLRNRGGEYGTPTSSKSSSDEESSRLIRESVLSSNANATVRDSNILENLINKCSEMESITKIIIISVALFLVVYVIQSGSDDNSSMCLRTVVSTYSNIITPRSEYKIAIITDLDKKSKLDTSKPKFKAILKTGMLKEVDGGKSYDIEWKEEIEYVTGHNEAGRGMETSELSMYDGKLYSGDDRTGIMYQLTPPSTTGPVAVPSTQIMEGNGLTNKGFKVEWQTVKDGLLYIGSFGKEYTNPDGSIKNVNNQWVMTMDTSGHIAHYDWSVNYDKLRAATGTMFPGYMIQEAVNWSDVHKKWFFLPRRVSAEEYDDVKDEKMGSNTIIIANEDFSEIELKHITPITPTRGFSTFKFVPNTKDNVIVALKSEESEALGTQTSHITVFDLDGNILLPETEIPGGYKYEGLEFIDGWI